ncbi:MAG: MFS transporter, partial [Limosilactobacillus sp.]|nr:MFS transporter [Limosilactobacillus sp.]
IMGVFFKIGLALGGIIPGYINAFCKFDGSATTQSSLALNGITLSMIWLPIIMAIIGMFVMKQYPLTDAQVDEINHKVEAERNA